MRNRLIVLIVLFSLVLGACSATPATNEPAAVDTAASNPEPTAVQATSAPAPTAAQADNSGDKVTLKVMLVDYIQDKTDTWLENEIVPAFQADHPNVDVEFIYVNWGTLDETIQGYFAAGEGADIINLGSEYVAGYGDKLAPLNQYLGEQAWPDIKQFVPASLDTVTWKGEIRGIPWLTAPRAYMCRTDLLAAAGIDKAPTTFAESVEEAGKATIITDNAVTQAGIVTTGRLDDWQEYLSLIWSLGGSLYKDDGSPAFDSPQAKDALQFMYDRRRAVYPDETTADLPQAQGSRLADGTAACLWANLWGAPATSDPVWDNIELVPGMTDPEKYPDSKPVVQVFNDWLAVPAYSKNIELAADFLKLLGTAENLNHYNADFGSFPPRQDAWTGYVADDPVMVQLSGLMNQYGIGFADIRETAQFREILIREMPAFFTDTQDIDTTLQNIQTDYTQVLQDAGIIQ